MAKQGKCDECTRLYQWPHETPIANTHCPVHWLKLKRATSRCKYGRFSVTNSDVEITPQKRRRPRHSTLEMLPTGPKIGPGTD
jgi:hypothetical protein